MHNQEVHRESLGNCCECDEPVLDGPGAMVGWEGWLTLEGRPISGERDYSQVAHRSCLMAAGYSDASTLPL